MGRNGIKGGMLEMDGWKRRCVKGYVGEYEEDEEEWNGKSD